MQTLCQYCSIRYYTDLIIHNFGIGNEPPRILSCRCWDKIQFMLTLSEVTIIKHPLSNAIQSIIQKIILEASWTYLFIQEWLLSSSSVCFAIRQPGLWTCGSKISFILFPGDFACRLCLSFYLKYTH